MIAQYLLARLDNVREDGARQWSARCPAHDDRTNSLSIGQADDNALLLHCHAGCPLDGILAAIGCTIGDLFAQNGESHASAKTSRRIVATYDYRNGGGQLLYQAVRFEPKDFRQRRPKEGGGWEWKLNGTARVLYRLPELLAADPAAIVFPVEGEKDVDRLRGAGLVATCNVGGAGKWKREYAEALRGRRCVVLPDNDEPGRQHAEAVANSLVGVAESVKFLTLPGLPDKGDVSDWLAAGGTAPALVELAEAAPEWIPTKGKRGASKPATQKSARGVFSIRPDELNLTDVGNGRRFAHQHGDRFRYCHEQECWYWWARNRWKIDNSGKAMQAAKEVVRRLYADAGKISDPTERAAMIEHAKATEHVQRIKAMLTLAPSETPFPVSPDEFDAEPWSFNCISGTLDLRTGKLQDHNPADLITKISPVRWDADAECQRWLAFLELIFQGNQNLITFIRRLLGYCLTGSTREQILPIFHGKGANGKSTLVGAIEHVMGDYGMTAPDGLLTVHRHEPHPTQLADLHGRRFVIATETEDGNAFAESLVKQLTGSDRIRARRMRENFWEFEPRHKIILQTNHRPKITGTDHAIWRRIRLVPFDYTIPEADRDKDFPAKLETEAAGILAWLVQGCLEWQQEGLSTPQEVIAATEGYRQSEDVLGGFLATCCTMRQFDKAGSSALFDAFKDYSGDRDMTQVKFATMLDQRGLKKYRITAGPKKGKIGWEGVGLLADVDDPTAAETGF